MARSTGGSTASAEPKPDHLQDAVEVAAPERRRSLRRGLVIGLVLAAACALIWMLSNALVDATSGNPHSSNEVEDVAGELDGAGLDSLEGRLTVVEALHGHLNWVVWGGGTYDAVGFESAVDELIATGDDPRHAAMLDTARHHAANGDLRDAHHAIERVEIRWRSELAD